MSSSRAPIFCENLIDIGHKFKTLIIYVQNVKKERDYDPDSAASAPALGASKAKGSAPKPPQKMATKRQIKENFTNLLKETIDLLRKESEKFKRPVQHINVGPGDLIIILTTISDFLNEKNIDQAREILDISQTKFSDLKKQTRIFLFLLNECLSDRNEYASSRRKIEDIFSTVGYVPRLNANQPPQVPVEYMSQDYINKFSDWSQKICSNPKRGKKSDEDVDFIVSRNSNVVRKSLTESPAITTLESEQDLFPNFSDTNYYSAKYMEADHLSPAHEIIQKINEMVEVMNLDSSFAEQMIAVAKEHFPKFKKPATGYKEETEQVYFLMNEQGEIFSTHLFYMFYFNSTDNLWMMLFSENNQKNDQSAQKWLENNDLGRKYLRFLQRQDSVIDETFIIACIRTRDNRYLVLKDEILNWLEKTNQTALSVGYLSTQIQELTNLVKKTDDSKALRRLAIYLTDATITLNRFYLAVKAFPKPDETSDRSDGSQSPVMSEIHEKIAKSSCLLEEFPNSRESALAICKNQPPRDNENLRFAIQTVLNSNISDSEKVKSIQSIIYNPVLKSVPIEESSHALHQLNSPTDEQNIVASNATLPTDRRIPTSIFGYTGSAKYTRISGKGDPVQIADNGDTNERDTNERDTNERDTNERDTNERDTNLKRKV